MEILTLVGRSETDREMLLKQRHALVEFGREALRSSDLPAVLERACELCREALGTELAKVLELTNDGRELLVVAGVGWEDGVVGRETIPALPTSSEGYALATGRPAVLSDIAQEHRFDYAEFLKRHGVQAIVNVVIPGADGRPPYGLLQVDSKTPREFTADDVEFLQGYANIVGAAIERHEYQRRLADAVETKELLLRELQHRVLNNLAVMGSLLKIRWGRSDNPVVRQNVADMLAQIEVLSEIYRKLHASSSTAQADLGAYLTSLCTGLAGLHSAGAGDVVIETETESVLVDADVAIPLGIVTNEFVTNSLKHAANGTCKVSLSMHLEDSSVAISLEDNGPGLKDALEKKGRGDIGGGLGLIEAMLRQIKAEWEWPLGGGARLDITLPLSMKAPADRVEA